MLSVDDLDYLIVKGYTWRLWKGKKCFYAATNMRTNKYKTTFIQNVLMQLPINFIVDHIDGNGLNNQRSNLRTAAKIYNEAATKHYGEFAKINQL